MRVNVKLILAIDEDAMNVTLPTAEFQIAHLVKVIGQLPINHDKAF